MVNIMLVCNWGASTAMLAEKIRLAAKERGIEANINAHSYEDIAEEISSVDVVLLGPQVAFRLDDFESDYGDKGVPFMVIDTLDYGRMNGGNVLDAALNVIKKNKGEN